MMIVCRWRSIRSRSRDSSWRVLTAPLSTVQPKRSDPVRHSSTLSSTASAPSGKVVTDASATTFMRGLVHAVILSSIVWIAAGYLTFVLR
jgi:hypothetical protein